MTSIAILPFADLSPGKDQEYFTDGLSEEVLNVLAKIPNLRVTGRRSSFQFKGKNEDSRAIGQKLNVTTLLEGSVRKAGNRVRITAQLVKVADGFHLWSETYDRELTDIFAVQDDIARAVSSALKVRLLGPDRAPLPARAQNAEVYNLYLQGKYFSLRRTKEDLQKAVTYYEQTLKLNPDYALAWSGLALTYVRMADNVNVPVDEGYRKGRQAVEKALTLDPNLAEALSTLGWIRRTYDWDWSGADAVLKRALELEPGSAGIVGTAGTLASTMGRFEEAVDLGRRAIDLDPLTVVTRRNLASYALHAGRLDEAQAALRKGLELNPEAPVLHLLMGKTFLMQAKPEAALQEFEQETDPFWRRLGRALAYHALGRKKEADAARAELLAENKEDTFQIAEVYAFRGETDKAFEWLERAYAQRDGGLAEIKGNPMLKSLETDRRYKQFLEKMRLPL